MGWPPCVARVDLAARVQTKVGLARRSARFLDEVVAPLLAPPRSSCDGQIAPLLAEARRFCVRRAQTWQNEPIDASDETSLRLTWSRMLRKALSAPTPSARETPDKSDYASDDDAWLRVLRSAVMARLCPQPDAMCQLGLLQGIGAASVSARTRGAADEDLPLLLLPLGVFTFWQALLLVGVARSLGAEATVVRRLAAGPASVIFRSSDVS